MNYLKNSIVTEVVNKYSFKIEYIQNFIDDLVYLSLDKIKMIKKIKFNRNIVVRK